MLASMYFFTWADAPKELAWGIISHFPPPVVNLLDSNWYVSLQWLFPSKVLTPLAWWGYWKDDRSHLLSSVTANLKDVGFTHITLLMIQFNPFVHSNSYMVLLSFLFHYLNILFFKISRASPWESTVQKAHFIVHENSWHWGHPL